MMSANTKNNKKSILNLKNILIILGIILGYVLIAYVVENNY